MKGENHMSFYVFRIDYGACYDLIKKELQEHKVLRQGWGCDGTDLRNGEDIFARTYDDGERRYRIIRPMLDMKPGDTLIIPKLNIDSPLGDWETSDEWANTFTIVRCTEGYSFAPISTEGYRDDESNDFGHMIGVELIGSFSYGLNDSSKTVSAKFKAYRKAVNNVHNEDFIEAAESLIAEKKTNSDTHAVKTPLEVLSASKQVIDARNDYLMNIIGVINGWEAKQLERIIEELFTRCGYRCINSNIYDGQGADVDLVFESFTGNTLLKSISELSSELSRELVPVIHVQAKNKRGIDDNDIEGAFQLVRTEGYEKQINILINMTQEFSGETKKYAAEKGIILINGFDFASLLVKYGIDTNIL